MTEEQQQASTDTEKTPPTLKEKWDRRRNLLVLLGICLAVSMIAYYSLHAVGAAVGLILFIGSLIFRPITG
jgi:uncharacterized membrane protein